MLTLDQARNLLPFEESKVRASENEQPLNDNQADLNQSLELLCSLSESQLKDLVTQRYKTSAQSLDAKKLFSLNDYGVYIHES